jgi:hypothetical protein
MYLICRRATCTDTQLLNLRSRLYAIDVLAVHCSLLTYKSRLDRETIQDGGKEGLKFSMKYKHLKHLMGQFYLHV